MLSILENYNNNKLYKPYYLDYISMVDNSRKSILGNHVFCYIDSKYLNHTYGVCLCFI